MSHCTVIIPTKNAMPGLSRVLDMVLRQKTPWPFDVIVIHSGSRDGTTTYAAAQPQVRVISVPAREFGHGRTRNQAIAASTAPFVALLTHDAEPLNDVWLARLVAAVEQNDRVAGAFGRHVAYPNASAYTKRDLDEHFASFHAHPHTVDKDLDPEKYQHNSGGSSCTSSLTTIRVSGARCGARFPFPNVNFAEDQTWAREIIAAGYAKAYAADAVVYHSHDYGLLRAGRKFDESRSFRTHFGYELCPSVAAASRLIVTLSARDIRYAARNGERSPMYTRCGRY